MNGFLGGKVVTSTKADHTAQRQVILLFQYKLHNKNEKKNIKQTFFSPSWSLLDLWTSR